MRILNPEISDMELLELLDLMDVQGLSASQVAPRFGRSRAAVLGLRHRVLRDLAASETGVVAARPENRDGGMPPGWWRKRRVAR